MPIEPHDGSVYPDMRITIAFTSLLLLTLSFMHPAAAATGRARAHLQRLVVDLDTAVTPFAAVQVLGEVFATCLHRRHATTEEPP